MLSRTLLAALVAGAAAHPVIEARQSAVNQTLESWIQRQFDISLESAIYNIGGVNGNVVEAAGTGYVVASPSVSTYTTRQLCQTNMSRRSIRITSTPGLETPH